MQVSHFISFPQLVCTKLGIPSLKNIEYMQHTHCQFLPQEYRRYAPDSMRILETWSEVKVTLTHKWYATLFHLKMHAHTKFGIPISNNTRDRRQTRIFEKLGQRSR